MVTLNSGDQINLQCATAEVYVRTDVAINQRIDGIQMVIDAKGRFSYVDFHTHEIQTISVSNANSKSNRVTVPAQPSNYLDYFKSKNLLLGRLEDDFYLRGPIGNPTGKYFVDDKYYDDWQLSAVIIEASAQRILSIQLHLNHTIFEKSVRTKIQGNQKRDASKTKTLVIPVGQHLSLARFYLNTHGVLTGLKLSIYNGNESDCFGLCPEYNDPKKDAKSSKTIYFSNKDNIVGVFGYSDEKGIGSLGVLLNIKRGTEGLYFVTQDN
jgi:hypothetical protein